MIVSGARKQAGEFLAPLPVALLRARPALADMPEALERLGIGTLGELAALAPAALADRFGTAGLHASPSWRAAATARCGHGRRASTCARRSSCRKPHRAFSWSACSGS